MNYPRLNITNNGIFYQDTFYKHSSYDSFKCFKDSIHFYKSFPDNDRKIFVIRNLDEEEVNKILQSLIH